MLSWASKYVGLPFTVKHVARLISSNIYRFVYSFMFHRFNCLSHGYIDKNIGEVITHSEGGNFLNIG